MFCEDVMVAVMAAVLQPWGKDQESHRGMGAKPKINGDNTRFVYTIKFYSEWLIL